MPSMLTLSVAVLQRCKPSESIYSISNLSQSGCAHLSRQTHQRNRFQPALLSAIYYESVRQNSDGCCYVHKMRKGKLNTRLIQFNTRCCFKTDVQHIERSNQRKQVAFHCFLVTFKQAKTIEFGVTVSEADTTYYTPQHTP